LNVGQVQPGSAVLHTFYCPIHGLPSAGTEVGGDSAHAHEDPVARSLFDRDIDARDTADNL